MAQIILNSAAGILASAALVAAAIASYHGQAEAMQKVPVRARHRRQPNG